MESFMFIFKRDNSNNIIYLLYNIIYKNMKRKKR